MIVQFKTLDDSMWAADIAGLKWAQIDRPASDPECLVLQRGELIAQGYGVYVMKGRTPKSPAPGEGLCNFGVMPVVSGQTLDIHLAANVPVTDFTMPVPVTRINYKIIERPGQKISAIRPENTPEVHAPKVSHPAATDPSVIDVPSQGELRDTKEYLPAATAICYPKELPQNLKDEPDAEPTT